MPKSRNKRKKPRHNKFGPLNRGPLPSLDQLRNIAKQLDCPELRELYRSQKELNPSLDSEVDELTEEIEEIFNHDTNSK